MQVCAQVQCCCFNNTGNPFANPNQVQGCCCGLQQDCCPSTVGGLAVCRGKGQYCFVVVVVCSMVMVFIVCIMALAWWTHRYSLALLTRHAGTMWPVSLSNVAQRMLLICTCPLGPGCILNCDRER